MADLGVDPRLTARSLPVADRGVCKSDLQPGTVGRKLGAPEGSIFGFRARSGFKP
jgi:hypothetical protein